MTADVVNLADARARAAEAAEPVAQSRIKWEEIHTLEDFKRYVLEGGGKFGGPMIKGFNGGRWALLGFGPPTPHLWIECTDQFPPCIGKGGRYRLWRSACGRRFEGTNEKTPISEAGNWDKCRFCRRKEGSIRG